MPRYVERDQSGKIKGTYNRRQPGVAEEQLPDDDPDLVSFESRNVAGDNSAALDAIRSANSWLELREAILRMYGE